MEELPLLMAVTDHQQHTNFFPSTLTRICLLSYRYKLSQHKSRKIIVLWAQDRMIADILPLSPERARTWKHFISSRIYSVFYATL